MSDKLHKTKGIVLRTVKYGETSIIATIFTELFGIQSYLLNGIRNNSKKTNTKSILFQPTAIVDLVVYHNELKHLNRIKEFKWHILYDNVLSNVPKNAVALFMIELLTKCLKQPEENHDLFNFTEDCLTQLDRSNGATMANIPLFFALHLTHFLGFKISDEYDAENCFLDLQEGAFVNEQPQHLQFLEGPLSFVTSQLLKVQHPDELDQIKLNQEVRRKLLHYYEIYYAMHIPDFGKMKTLPVLREILG